MEDRLLENDFSYDAMEGLEQVPWEQYQRQLEATEARIIEEFSLEPAPGLNKNIAIALAGLLATVAAVWYFSYTTTETVDLTTVEPEVSSSALKQEDEPQVTDTISGIKTKPLNPIENAIQQPEKASAVVNRITNKSLPKKSVDQLVSDNIDHITVGRVVDIKGIPIQDAVVSSGAVSDTTDKSGYYALKIAKGSTRIEVLHLTTSYLVEIDTNQNWEIVLDIVDQAVKDYYPMNPANRFK